MTHIERTIAQLQASSTRELKNQFAEIFGHGCSSGNRVWLTKRIAWGIQMRREGDISERAKQRALDIATTSDLRTTIPKPSELGSLREPQPAAAQIHVDARLPMPGAILTRRYKGQNIEVTVLRDGFEYGGKPYRSLSAVAKAITGSHCNGYTFFGLTRKPK
jgi:hypothetical protein